MFQSLYKRVLWIFSFPVTEISPLVYATPRTRGREAAELRGVWGAKPPRRGCMVRGRRLRWCWWYLMGMVLRWQPVSQLCAGNAGCSCRARRAAADRRNTGKFSGPSLSMYQGAYLQTRSAPYVATLIPHGKRMKFGTQTRMGGKRIKKYFWGEFPQNSPQGEPPKLRFSASSTLDPQNIFILLGKSKPRI